MAEIKVLGFVGSLREGSFNRKLMNIAREELPEGVSLEVADIGRLPLFNEDLEKSAPAEVTRLKQQIEDADAILFATPEYNYSVPGVLKNAIDWASRPYGNNSFDGKTAAVMGASVGMIGTARAQYHLRQMFVFLNIQALNKPEVMVSYAAKHFDENGELINDDTRRHVARLVAALVERAQQQNEASSAAAT